MRPLVIPLAAVVLLASAGTARAQDVLVEGPGIKMGESTVFHPRIGLEGGVVSNVFYEEDDAVLSPILRVKGGFDIAPAGEDRLGEFDEQDYRTIDFRIGAEAEYTEYIKDDEDVRDQRNVDVEANGNLTFFPQGNVAFILNDKFQRVGRPTNFESDEHLDRDINAFRAELKIQPRGHTISGGPRYENVIDIFESDSVEFANRIQHIFGARVNWKFFPYSQAYIDGSVGFYDALGDNEVDGMDYKIGSTPVRAILGLDTVVTEMTTLNAYAGYANGFYDSGPSYNSVIGGAQLGWRYFSTGRLVGGYRYDVNDSINANYYGEHHFHLGVQHQIRTVVLSANGGYRLRGYRGVPEQVGGDDSSRDDTIVEAHGRIDWILYERFGIYVDYGLQSVDSDFEGGGMDEGDNTDDPSFLRQEAVLGLVAAF
jgi:Putative beta-barrel porin 2